METSWKLYSVNEESDENISVIAKEEEGFYVSNENYSTDHSLAPGKYRLTLKDIFGDGFGTDGWYKISLDGREIIRGDQFRFEISYDIVVGYNPEMSDRDEEWLVAHNGRRKIWHESHGKTYMPLLWSKELAENAASWAQELVKNDCAIKNEPDIEEGENIAKNTYQKLDPADNVSVLFLYILLCF